MSSNIIKAYTLDRVVSSRRNLVKQKVGEARREAVQIVEDANLIASETAARAELEAAQLRREALEQGREQSASEFNETLANAYQKRDATLRDIEPEVLKLAVKIAEKIIGRELQTDRKAIADMVAAALRNVRQQERLIIRVNPSDLATVEEFKSSLNHAGRATFLDFEPDPKIQSGGCIIESEVGTVDARLETQLKILERALLRQAEAE